MDFGVVVTLVILYYGPDSDQPVKWEEKLSPERCIAAVTQGLLAESLGKGSIRNGGSVGFECWVDIPHTEDH